MIVKKKTCEQTAWKFNRCSVDRPDSWAITYRERIQIRKRRDGSVYLEISTKYGIMEAEEGDIITIDRNGYLFLYKPDVFELLFDVIE